VIQPTAGSYTSTTSGTHRGCLRGPSGVDFDLYLQKRSSTGAWSNVAQSISTSANEDITYSGAAGTYRWRILSYSGSGAFTGGYTKPT
jgi:streptogrisin C